MDTSPPSGRQVSQDITDFYSDFAMGYKHFYKKLRSGPSAESFLASGGFDYSKFLIIIIIISTLRRG